MDERRQAEEQLRQAQKMEAIGRLAGGVAHDFNNLLTVIRGYAEILLGDARARRDPAQPHVEEIRRPPSAPPALTRQLLAFSRKQVLQPRVLDLNDVVRGLEPMLAPADRRGHRAGRARSSAQPGRASWPTPARSSRCS